MTLFPVHVINFYLIKNADGQNYFFKKRSMKKTIIFSIYLIMVVSFCYLFPALNARECEIKQYLLPKNHPLQIPLKNLFQTPNMFDSPREWHLSGFQVLDRVHRKLMVARHPTVNNYLFKKFQNTVSAKKQLNNYLKRTSGAKALSQFIIRNHINHIIVPKKWLYPLPKKFSDSKTKEQTYILIVEEMDICGGGVDPMGEVALHYQHIQEELLKELCFVVFCFRGLDSMLHNMPFTYQNKITFIDTEKWKEKREGYLQKAMPFLRPESQAYALEIFKALENQEIKLK